MIQAERKINNKRVGESLIERVMAVKERNRNRNRKRERERQREEGE